MLTASKESAQLARVELVRLEASQVGVKAAPPKLHSHRAFRLGKKCLLPNAPQTEVNPKRTNKRLYLTTRVASYRIHFEDQIAQGRVPQGLCPVLFWQNLWGTFDTYCTSVTFHISEILGDLDSTSPLSDKKRVGGDV